MSFKETFLYTELIKKPVKQLLCSARRVSSGTNTYISPFAGILFPKRIRLGNDVVIEQHARLSADGSEARISIGDHTFLRPYVLLKTDGGSISIGNDCTINDYCVLYGHGDLTIGNFVRIATHTVIVPMNHNYQSLSMPIAKQGIIKAPVVIEDDVWIGAGAVILTGVRIGTGSVIGAGAVVTSDIPPYSVAFGVPAKVHWKRGDTKQ